MVSNYQFIKSFRHLQILLKHDHDNDYDPELVLDEHHKTMIKFDTMTKAKGGVCDVTFCTLAISISFFFIIFDWKEQILEVLIQHPV